MLVLSRRPTETIVFPSINAAVHVLKIESGRVRIGIDAPLGVAVVRKELLDRQGHRDLTPASVPLVGPDSLLSELKHLVRNRLNRAHLGLALLRRQLQVGLTQSMEVTIGKIEEALAILGGQMEDMSQSVVAPPFTLGELIDKYAGVEDVSQAVVAPPPMNPPRPRKALLVEDDRNECELMAGFLRLAGFEVHTENDGADALDYLCDHADRDEPDVMLLDMGLPRCDGPHILRTIQEYHAYTGAKIFAVTGHRPEEFSPESGVNRIDRWFQKPIHPEDLLRELNAELMGGN